MFSFWEKNHWFSNYDFAVIGSGIVGISTAIELKNKFPNKTTVVIEAGVIPTGASTKNAGFACFGTVGEIVDDLKSQSVEEIKHTIKMRWDGLKLLKQAVNLDAMNYKSFGGTEVFANKLEFENCEAKLQEVNELIYDSIGVKNVIELAKQEFSANLYHYSLFNKYEGQLNPVLMMKALIKKAINLDIDIVNNFKVVDFKDKGSGVNLNLERDMTLNARKLVVCTNAFSKTLLPDIEVQPARNQVIVSKPISNIPLNGAFHYNCGYVYFRNIGNRILIGGARNIDSKNETTSLFGENPIITNHLLSFIKYELNISQFEIEKKWSGIIATGSSKRPHILKYSDNVYTALRLGGMGVAVGSKAANEVVDLVDLP